MGKKQRLLPDGDYKVPEGIENFTDDKKREIAREMCRVTKLSNREIADAVRLPIKSVITIRGHVEGKLHKFENLPKTGAETVEGVVIHDIDEKATEKKPSPGEARLLHLESGLSDITSRFAGLETTVNNRFEELKNMIMGLSVVTTAPAEKQESESVEPGGIQPVPGNGKQETQITAFESFIEKVPVSARYRTLFAMWRANNNRLARIDPKHYKTFDGSLGDLMIMATDEFFALRGAKIVYREEMDPGMWAERNK